MKSLFSYLIITFVVFFWILRIAVAVTASMAIDIGIQPINLTIEIILLFVTLVSILLIIKRNIIGGILYFSTYLLYFGATTITQVIALAEDSFTSDLKKNRLKQKMLINCIILLIF